MPSNGGQKAQDYAESIRGRLPRRLQELREGFGLSKYGPACESGQKTKTAFVSEGR
jgi:hypothetical protein